MIRKVIPQLFRRGYSRVDAGFSNWIAEARQLSRLDRVLASIALPLVAWLHIGMAAPVADAVPGLAKWGAYGAWLCVALVNDRRFAREFAAASWPLAVVVAYSAVAPLWGASDLQRYHYGFGYLLIVYSFFVYYSRAALRPMRVVFVAFLVVDIMLMGIITWVALNENSGVSRLLSTSQETRLLFLGDGEYYGVGGYGYVYSLGSVAVFLGVMLLNRRGKRWIVGALLVLDVLLLVKASFAIAVLITFAVLSVLALFRMARVFGPKVAVGTSVVAIGAVVGTGVALLRGPSRLSEFSPALELRLRALAEVLEDGTLGESLEPRLARYGESLTAFMHNVAFGASADAERQYSRGGHSEWLDLFAEFGLLAALFVVFLVKAYRLTIERVGAQARRFVNASWAYFLILGLVNPLLFADMLLMWFLFVPIAATMIPASDTPARPRRQRGLDTKPTVLVLHHSSEVGGGTRSLIDVLEMLRADYRIVVCAPASPTALSSLLRSERYEYLPMTLPPPVFNHYNGGSPILSRTFLGGWLRFARHRASWTELIRSVEPDLVVVNSAVLLPLGPVIRASGAKSLCFVRETFPSRRRSPRTRMLYRALDRGFDGVLFLTHGDQNRAALSRAANEVVRDCIGSNTLPTVDRTDASELLRVPADTFNILYVGGASRIKGLDVALSAMNFVEQADIRLIVAGDMSAVSSAPMRRPAWRRLVDRKSATFEGAVRDLLEQGRVAGRTLVVGIQSDMAPCYSVADVLVFPSTSPHQARPVFEAGAHGLPVVIADFVETAELVTDGVNGLTFPPGDAGALADQILSLYADPDLARELGEANRLRAATAHSFETERARVLEFVDRLLYNEASQGFPVRDTRQPAAPESRSTTRKI